MAQKSTLGLVLSGGGARAAYQAGVLLAVSRLLPDASVNPFPIICGTSAGAINATALAASADNFRRAVISLIKVWRRVHVSEVYDAGSLSLLKTFLHFGVSILSGGHLWKNPQSLLDNAPLRQFLRQGLAFDGIASSVEKGALHALALTASCYSTGMSVSFFEGRSGLAEWSRHQRVGIRDCITLDHLMASAAIPLIFPAARLGDRYYCDGAVRQMAPLSPAVHLGADKLFVIGLTGRQPVVHERRLHHGYPSLKRKCSGIC
ncbi:patatin-like phospholipase family protein [Paludibacterium denitrificans]|uniref:patatin-like phospholipase family protein n=1 Tax=Paludibacterium denitrificans TaxID=2675226 RepID=UPI001E3ED7F1|nr:patatin-like phospholipase family protein [Paludibacterium denitrificans]